MEKKIISVFVLTGILLITFGFISNNLQYRNSEKGKYQILDTAYFYLYYRYEQVEKVRGKSLIKTDEYFFSRNAESPIQLLTAENLKRAFPDNLPFHYAIDAEFKRDQDLITYDPYYKGYKLKYIYNQSLK
jgi:hypothetical protein